MSTLVISVAAVAIVSTTASTTRKPLDFHLSMPSEGGFSFNITEEDNPKDDDEKRAYVYVR